jgi:hypothetical protein
MSAAQPNGEALDGTTLPIPDRSALLRGEFPWKNADDSGRGLPHMHVF